MTTATAPVLSPSPLRAWFLATRPRTLTAALAPVSVGSAIAFREGHFVPLTASIALLGALLIQIGTNLANDAFDFQKGADTAERQGPPRATQQGWLTPRQVLTGAMLCFAAAFLVGLYLVAVAGWPILLVGLISIAAGYAYTGGPFPLAYNGLGDAFVFVFFGLVAVGGTQFVQSQHVTLLALLSGAAIGALGVALLSVNNLRDEVSDRKVGKLTLVARFGQRFGRAEWLLSVAFAFAVPVILVATQTASSWVLLSWLAVPLSMKPLKTVFTATGAALNAALAATAKLQLVFGLLLALGLCQ